MTFGVLDIENGKDMLGDSPRVEPVAGKQRKKKKKEQNKRYKKKVNRRFVPKEIKVKEYVPMGQ